MERVRHAPHDALPSRRLPFNEVAPGGASQARSCTRRLDPWSSFNEVAPGGASQARLCPGRLAVTLSLQRSRSWWSESGLPSLDMLPATASLQRSRSWWSKSGAVRALRPCFMPFLQRSRSWWSESGAQSGRDVRIDLGPSTKSLLVERGCQTVSCPSCRQHFAPLVHSAHLPARRNR